MEWWGVYDFTIQAEGEGGCSTILGTGDIAHAGTDSTQVDQTKSYTRVADGWRIVFVVLLQ